MKRVIILGSTGSIGENALNVAREYPDRIKVVGLSTRSNCAALLRQAAMFGVDDIAVADSQSAGRIAGRKPEGMRMRSGPAALVDLVESVESDMVLCAVVGIAGLAPVMAAVQSGTDVALATKEVLVAAGEIVTRTCRETGAGLLPVDSEHSGIHQCLAGRSVDAARRLILTASGGPFGNKPEIDFDKVDAAAALRHPNWSMGKKVSIDSATLMNKGLEVIEASRLFGMDMDRIDVLVHPESIVHALVEFVDGAMLAQLSLPDMRFAIQYALTYPDALSAPFPRLDLAGLEGLHFREVDNARFPCLGLARAAGCAGGTMPAVLNAANEIAVSAFLAEKISFPGIWHVIEKVMNEHDIVSCPDMSAILDADRWARAGAERECARLRS